MPHHRVDDLAAFLAGGWTVERSIVPMRGVPGGGFTGHAEVSRHPRRPGWLTYREQGTVVIGDHIGPASRTLRYEVDGPTARVRFDDGRFFHDLDLRAGGWFADHPCGQDLYRGRFTVLGPDVWEQRWTVSGPTEAYRMRTRLERLVRR